MINNKMFQHLEAKAMQHLEPKAKEIKGLLAAVPLSPALARRLGAPMLGRGRPISVKPMTLRGRRLTCLVPSWRCNRREMSGTSINIFL